MAVFKTFRSSAVGWVVCVSVLGLAVRPLEAAPRLTLSPHHVPAAVSNLKPIGRLPADTQLQLEIGLPLRNGAELDALLQQIYDPASTNFHHYLSPEEFNVRF